MCIYIYKQETRSSSPILGCAREIVFFSRIFVGIETEAALLEIFLHSNWSPPTPICRVVLFHGFSLS